MSGNFGSYNPAGTNIPPEYKPIGMWGYYGYGLLFNLPCGIGLILTLVFAFGGTENLNLKNYARAQFCNFIIVLAIILLVFMFMFLIYGTSFLAVMFNFL